MERPRLRPLDAYPTEENGQRLLVLRDPSGLTDSIAKLPAMAVIVIQLCDGRRSRDQICEEFSKRYPQKLERRVLDNLLDQLERLGMLDSEPFREKAARLFAEYAALETRPPLNAGRIYSADPEKLRAQLDGYFTAPQGPGKPAPASRPLPRAIISPSLELRLAGLAYSYAYKAIAEAVEAPDLVVVLGYANAGSDHALTLTRKHYDTPLGRLTTDVELVDALVARTPAAEGGAPVLLADEHLHRGESSVELQMVWLRHVLGERADGARFLPVLCGNFEDYLYYDKDPVADPALGGTLRAIGELTAGRRVLWVAGADLSHVGPRFGDEQPLDGERRKLVDELDQETLKLIAAADAPGLLQSVKAESDARNLRGFSSIYSLLTGASPGPGRTLLYAQSPVEAGSIVSIAPHVFP